MRTRLTPSVLILMALLAARGHAQGDAASAFEERLLEIAKTYRGWGKVVDTARVAPRLCAVPPVRARRSRSDDRATHGTKLYFLYAKDAAGYVAFDERADAPGQVIVKESFHAKTQRTADGERLVPGERAPLFVMFRDDPNTRGTDDGWVYGTLTPDGTRVTAAGRLQSCMRCHAGANRGRLFGLAEDAPLDPRFVPRALEIAKGYTTWHRVGDQSPGWSPLACSMPKPGTGRLSESGDVRTHGRKLYYLYAKDRVAYRDGTDAIDAPGQVVVKEAWKPVQVGADERPNAYTLDAKTGRPYARDGDDWFKPGPKAGLFVMFRLDPKTEGTDDGWVYATVAPDGKRVTAAGRIGSCMSCHRVPGQGRLFGL
jgi:hypothetical protein